MGGGKPPLTLKSSMMTPAEWRNVLLKIAPHGKPWIFDGFADALPGLCERYAINTAERQAHFIAQCAHESDGFATTQEYASGSAYEGRRDLGNTQKGDGRKYKGRGLIQLTGRANYTAAGKAMDQPYVEQPEMVERFPAAADVSGWFWGTHDLNHNADKNDVRTITRIINGGYTGLDSRVAYLNNAKSALA
jgi:putative chitinase